MIYSLKSPVHAPTDFLLSCYRNPFIGNRSKESYRYIQLRVNIFHGHKTIGPIELIFCFLFSFFQGFHSY